ncbi:hypothetical protein [Methylobacterium iners]|uniref:Uncharacterized protein n=1 Tax=Methylobacterium iners TaxID=418707 RepID=A0ABQ4S3C3_9HYPH|nr:hypothetical protein [Methylobacterium iners]GJD96907.1 hypothetical protein OCOJLMKI_4134 [Methylobacterium iners]
MSDEPKTSTEDLANSAYDQKAGHLTQKPGAKPEGSVTSAADPATGRLPATPERAGARPGTEADEYASGPSDKGLGKD